jgi:hypothetical protein
MSDTARTIQFVSLHILSYTAALGAAVALADGRMDSSAP